ncbi:hypothetical protein BX600DRAFT_431307 [Xylariales sp. PMI_506]|nr:hypothetical protein BX600DRAFT_431307 [Xylariales sp. PMI_506]
MPLDTESQFKFLIACIKHSSNGKVDFNEVAKECSIVSKGAAAKRYERLMKAHGITNPAAGSSKTPVKKEEGVSSAKSTPRKKRKLETVDENAGDIDEPIKGEVKSEMKFEDEMKVKFEGGSGMSAITPSITPKFPGIARDVDGDHDENDDDGDEVLLVSAREKRVSSSSPYRHSHHLSIAPPPGIPIMPSPGYDANMSILSQTRTMMNPMTPMTPMMPPMSRHESGIALPYGFPPASPHMHNHDSSGFYWHGIPHSHSQG